MTRPKGIGLRAYGDSGRQQRLIIPANFDVKIGNARLVGSVLKATTWPKGGCPDELGRAEGRVAPAACWPLRQRGPAASFATTIRIGRSRSCSTCGGTAASLSVGSATCSRKRGRSPKHVLLVVRFRLASQGDGAPCPTCWPSSASC